MPKATQPTTTRRRLCGGSAALLAIAGLLPMTAAAEAPNSHPDAELIRICAEHPINMQNYNDLGDMRDDNDALWAAYERTRNAISAAEPQTMEGILAKARAAKAEAVDGDGDGEESWGGSMGEPWAFDIVNDLLRVVGGAA
jgi:hypothetical protein